MNIKAKLEQGILLMDGAMGTYYNQLHPNTGEAEEANITHGDWITEIHKQYIEAGANLICTNTFAINHLLFPEEKERKAQIKAAVSNARAAVGTSDVLIAADIGPLRQEMDMEMDAVLAEYRELVDTFLEEDIHIFVLETFAEPDVLKQLARIIKQKDEQAFVIGQCTVNLSGYTKFGYSMQRLVTKLGKEEALDVYGFNCGLGASHYTRMLNSLVYPKEGLVAVVPNAGYQQELRGRLRYTDNPDYYAQQMKRIIELGANVVGGCCGTTPEHIRCLSNIIKKEQLVSGKKRVGTVVSGSATVEEMEPNIFMEKLENGKEKVFVVELDSPFGADANRFRKGAFALQENGVDMITVSDSPMARARADAFEMAVYVKDKVGAAVMPHIACRDRNLVALRSGILGAHINDIRKLLIITGDPVAREDRSSVTSVFDVNSIRLMEYVKNMNRELFPQAPMYYGGALNYAGVNVEAIITRMNKKIEAGCSYFLSQPVYSKEDIERIAYLKQRVDTKILCGLMPLVSYKNALFMKNEMPGIHVPDEVLEQYRPDMSREEAEEVAVSVCVDTAKALADVVDGYYIMTPFHRVHLVNRIVNEIRAL